MSEIDQAFDSFLRDEEEADPMAGAQTLRSGTIFLVDCTASILRATTGLPMAISCCQKFQQFKALESPLDMIGLVLMRTRESSSKQFSNIYVIQNLDIADASRILELECLSQLTMNELATRFGTISDQPESRFELHEALWACQNMFTSCPKTLGHRQIYLLTDDMDPLPGDLHAQRLARTKINDLKQSNIRLDVIPINLPTTKLDSTLFYHTLLSDESFDLLNTDPCPASEIRDPAKTVDEVLSRTQFGELPRHRVARFRFYLGPSSDMALGVASYCLVRRATPPAPVWLSAADNQPVTVRKQWYKSGVSTEDNPPLLPHDLVRCLKLGKRDVCFEREELATEVTSLAPVGLFLLGFKPIDQLLRHYHLRPTQFLYPDEYAVRGSRIWFSTLLDTCLDRKLFAMALYVPRRSTAPRLVALRPQAEHVRPDRTQVTPPGFHIIFLPYADDFRDLELPSYGLAPEDQVEAAKSMIKKLTFQFESKQFPNPVIQRHRAVLEAIALERDTTDDVVDRTMPDFQDIRKRAGPEIDTFRQVCHLSDDQPDPPKVPRTPKSAPANPESNLSVDELRQLHANNALHQLTVPVLLRAVRLLDLKPTSRTKSSLIAQLTEHFS